MSNNHIIHNLNFDIKGFKNNSEYHHFANRISAIVRSSLSSKLQRLFDKYQSDGYHIIIKSIEIDLGYINPRNLENNILVKIDKFLERHLMNIKTKVDYQIKNSLTGYQNMIAHNQSQFDIYKRVFTQQSQSGKDKFSSSITGEIIDIIPEKILPNDLMVLPNDAQYHEAILHFLEYGWLPRHLGVPEENFQEIFSSFILENHDYILKYFGRKPQRKKAQVIERLEKQVSAIPNSLSQKGKSRRQLKHLNLEISKEKFRIIAKTVQSLPTSNVSLSKEEKKLIKEIFNDQYLRYTEINKLSELIYEVENKSKISVQKEIYTINSELENIINQSNLSISKKEKLKALKEKADKDYDEEKDDQSFIPFPPSAKELFDEQIKILLDSNDKAAFSKLLDTKFYKSITKSYDTNNNSIENISRAFISIILNPKEKEAIFANLPDYIQTEKEIVNQLYRISPILVVESLKTLIRIEQSSTVLQARILTFISNLNKSHIVLIMKALLSNYTKVAPILSFINHNGISLFPKAFQAISKNKLSETSIINEYLNSNKNIVEILHDFIEEKIKQVVEKGKNINTKEVKKRIKNHLPRLSERSFSTEELSYSLGIKQLVDEQERTLNTNVIDQFKVLINDSYLPSIKKDLSPQTISQLIEKIKKEYQHSKVDPTEETQANTPIVPDDQEIINNDEEKDQASQSQADENLASEPKTIKEQIKHLAKTIETDKIDEKEIKKLQENKKLRQEIEVLPEIFDTKKVLKNKILRQLSKKEFTDLLEIVLPTTSFRKFMSLFDKYHFLWKTGIDEKQVQVIFLSLVKHHKHVDHKTIFKFFFDQLKQYKAWTNEILKRRIIERFEKHVDYLLKDEKELVIKYIDQIDTLDGIALKDMRMKLEKGIPVKNAGLVLLWPFFKTLFQLTDLIDDNGEFKNYESRERATLLLQYVAVKSSKVVESYLALNKVLTGFPLEDTMASEIILSEKETDISEALLKNVIKQWAAISSSSVDNLRGSFIIRDGILSFRNNQWILKVETKPYDLLLGKLPWGYSMIRLSWIPYLIKVEWN